MERTISRVRPATDVQSGVRTDLSIIATIGSRLYPELIDGSPDPAGVFTEFATLTAGTVADCSGIDYERLDEEHAVRWPTPDADSAGGYRYHECALDGESWSFPTASGNAQFSTGRQQSLPEPTDEEYPLTLTTAREADGYNTGVRSRGGESGELVARIHPNTVGEYEDVVEDNRISVRSRRGSATARIDHDEGVPEGMVWLPIHHPATNRLTLPDRDPESDEPHFKQCAVELAPVETDAAADAPAPADD
jgi:assimilatory nitrate reductase catalytic subunit